MLSIRLSYPEQLPASLNYSEQRYWRWVNGDKEKTIDEEGKKVKVGKDGRPTFQAFYPITIIKATQLADSMSIYAYINEACKNLFPQKKWPPKSGCVVLKGKMQEIKRCWLNTVGTNPLVYSNEVKGGGEGRNNIIILRPNAVCVCVLVTQLCPTLCDPMDCSPLGTSVHGILQTRILEWVYVPFSRGSSWPRDQTRISHIGSRFFTVWASRETTPKALEKSNLAPQNIKNKILNY